MEGSEDLTLPTGDSFGGTGDSFGGGQCLSWWQLAFISCPGAQSPAWTTHLTAHFLGDWSLPCPPGTSWAEGSCSAVLGASDSESPREPIRSAPELFPRETHGQARGAKPVKLLKTSEEPLSMGLGSSHWHLSPRMTTCFLSHFFCPFARHPDRDHMPSVP
jgi:hypothetical protein